MVVEWLAGGSQRIRTIHQFGAATTDETSPHYADQVPIFAEKGFKSPPLTLAGALAQSTEKHRRAE
jgi:penicillin amidase/acyl-homoserine-lactone acylase